MALRGLNGIHRHERGRERGCERGRERGPIGGRWGRRSGERRFRDRGENRRGERPQGYGPAEHDVAISETADRGHEPSSDLGLGWRRRHYVIFGRVPIGSHRAGEATPEGRYRQVQYNSSCGTVQQNSSCGPHETGCRCAGPGRCAEAVTKLGLLPKPPFDTCVHT